MGDPVIIVPYNPEWPVWFQQLRAYLEPALAGIDTIIEHVGSTSVFGLMAKPIIDTDIIIDRPLFPKIRDRLTSIGYTHQGDLGITDREAFAADHLPPGVSLPPHHLCVHRRRSGSGQTPSVSRLSPLP
jgi:GrpB-like predicted nucleotidyltransferase (UPF0157 family)